MRTAMISLALSSPAMFRGLQASSRAIDIAWMSCGPKASSLRKETMAAMALKPSPYAYLLAGTFDFRIVFLRRTRFGRPDFYSGLSVAFGNSARDHPMLAAAHHVDFPIPAARAVRTDCAMNPIGHGIPERRARALVCQPHNIPNAALLAKKLCTPEYNPMGWVIWVLGSVTLQACTHTQRAPNQSTAEIPLPASHMTRQPPAQLTCD